MIFASAFFLLAADLYRNHLKNREFDKEASQNFCAERASIAARQGVSESKNFEIKPTMPKTDSSRDFGISDVQMMEIGLRVWQNECAATIDGLASWNERENFASLGIGHFIWYPTGRGPYVETFPALLSFLKENGVDLPRWLDESKRCPWKTRIEFLRAKGSKKMLDLKRILKETIPLQAQFLALRLENALPELQKGAPEPQKEKIFAAYQRLKKAPGGLYALIDYVNFKGYGTSEQERYAGSGWGLLQVLERMSDEKDAIEEFIRCAKEVLSQRVKNAPAERGEQFYLRGWQNRLDTYRPLQNLPH